MSDFFTPKIVGIVIIASVAIIMLLNLALNLNKVKNDTVNNRLSIWANGKYFFITFFWGVLGGHFFLGTETPLFCCNWWLPVVLLIVLSALLLIAGKHIKIKAYHQAILIVLGLLYGHIIWSQRHEAIVFNKDGQCINTNIFCQDD